LKASLQHHIKTGKPLSIEAYANQCHVNVELKKAAWVHLRAQSDILDAKFSEISLSLASDFARFPELAEKVGGFFEHRDVKLPREIIDFTSSQ
jgi:hypothetical protein